MTDSKYPRESTYRAYISNIPNFKTIKDGQLVNDGIIVEYNAIEHENDDCHKLATEKALTLEKLLRGTLFRVEVKRGDEWNPFLNRLVPG